MRNLEALASRDLIDARVRSVRSRIARTVWNDITVSDNRKTRDSSDAIWPDHELPFSDSHLMHFFFQQGDFLQRNKQKGWETHRAHMLDIIRKREANEENAMRQRVHLFFLLRRRGEDTALSGVKPTGNSYRVGFDKQFELLSPVSASPDPR